MIATPAIRNLIRENKIAQMYRRSRPDRAWACRRSTRTWPTWCGRNVISAAEGARKAKIPKLPG